MKKSISLILLFLLSACSIIYFDEPQPENKKALKTVPEKFRGKWIKKNNEGFSDTIYISEKGYLKINVGLDSLKKVIITKEDNFLSESLILKKSGEYYVINGKMIDENIWGIAYIVKKEKNGDIVFYNPNRFPFFGERKGLKVYQLYFTNDSLVNIESINDIKIQDTAKIESLHYKGSLKSKDIEKIILPQNIDFILKKDGSVVYPK